MKKTIKQITLVSIFTLFSTTIFSQINTIKVSDSDNTLISPVPYDSIEDFVMDDVGKLIGQELYVRPKSNSFDRDMGYSGFFKENKKGEFDEKNIYKCCAKYGGSKYSELNGKYYRVVAVYKHPKAKDNPSQYGRSFLIKLQQKDNDDICYYLYPSNFTLDFVIVGYFEKQKQLLVGKQFLIRERKYGSYVSINSGNEIKVENGSVWKCTDVGIEPKSSSPAMVLEDNNGEKIYLEISWLEHKRYAYAFELTESEKLKKEYGEENWKLILKGKVKIGMTKEMCKISWGAPKEINETILEGKKSEQWVFKDNYLYFDNDILTAIQK